ncbi:hypothetical protein MPTK1_1g21510 [Marchantia polymorpha subsp. ruderalis]|uniref:RING-type domain-containing protein n=2 Tax=Marchantia polymorpha TaxID=3197 RepID=A0AAF6ASQ5_MARPO|nr:hypothetical protein MARPO_0001s0486 [Marchantia polymorpha]BBM99475.1 hypothetical protein Mp_1g21510 [Marchantia polymorpha subsp. ruderalis]|eukprot:PTQ50557.1 hypothetical protein MARPO_0001s0486 [Marchantia polymorpha]
MLTTTSYNAQRLTMTRGRTVGLLQALGGHCSLLCFSGLLIAKLEDYLKVSWWYVFVPLWIFHAVVARGRFSLPAPAPPHDRQWAPCHTVVAVPLLVSFELLLCCYLATLEASHTEVVSLKVVFLPLLVFQAIILIDNFRMCRALMPGDEESMTDEAIWETLPHFWVAVSMVFFLAATMFTLLKLSGDVGALGWWDLFINFGIAECFSFLVCTKWSNPTIQRDAVFHAGSGGHSSVSPLISMSSVIHDAAHGSSSANDEDDGSDGMCGRQEIGGHLLKIPVLVFQVLLCMRLEGTPAKAKHLPVTVIFAPLLVVQVLACIFATIRLFEQFWLMLRLGDNHTNPMAVFSRLNDCCGFLHHGSRLLGWWSIDETSREEHARLYSSDSSSYHTFSGPAPEVVKKMARKDLAEEVWRLQAVLGEQAEITKHQQQEFDRLQTEKVLCRVCFERDIAVVLLPCRHRILCSFCSEKCKQCPVCRASIEQRMPVYDV